MQILIIGVAVVVMAAIGYFFMGSSETANVPANQNQAETRTVEDTNNNTNSGAGVNVNVDTGVKLNTNTSHYKNGTFTQVGTYNSPAGSENVTVSVTLQNDVVTAATFKGEATNNASINNQNKFKSGFTGMVVGKPVDSIALTVVNGSSLTPKGFMDALDKIKLQAKM